MPLQLPGRPGMRGQADAMLMSLVLHNLIGNTWTFSTTVPEAQITVSSEVGRGASFYFTLGCSLRLDGVAEPADCYGCDRDNDREML